MTVHYVSPRFKMLIDDGSVQVPEGVEVRVRPLPFLRTHDDQLGDEIARSTGVDFSGESFTRQEFVSQTDLRQVVKRFGPAFAVGPVGESGEVDFDQDLQSAFLSVQAARQAFSNLPSEVRSKYPTWHALAADLISGKLTATKRPQPTPSTGSTVEGGGSPSAGDPAPAGA